MLNNIIKAMNDYDNAYKEAEKVKRAEIAKWESAMYGESLEAKVQVIKEQFKDEIESLKGKYKEICDKIIEDTKAELYEILSSDTPEVFTGTLEAIKAKGEYMTDYEAHAYLKKYANNYPAYSAIVRTIKAVGKLKDIEVVSGRTIESYLNNITSRVNQFFEEYNHETLATVLMLSENSDLSGSISNLQKFIDGNFQIEAVMSE